MSCTPNQWLPLGPACTVLSQMDADKQLQPVLQCLLQQHSMTRQQAAAFLHSNPHVLYSSNYTVVIQQLVRRQKLQQLALL